MPRIKITCEHPPYTDCSCEGNGLYDVETADAARALHAAQFPGIVAEKIAKVVITCRVNSCYRQMFLRVESVAEARTFLSQHNYGWYLARRSGGRLVDGCQWHLGNCCVHHASRPDPTLDPAAVLPGDADHPYQPGRTEQLDLFARRSA
ncbi:hypothetical protein ACIBEJ_00830 [Nonomuraea sp. NPDC050790]|uniref:hypothetical protein n=1 Tax=Nonomuraea sp. NPDC050790 TaxID=3364371 RepID=UPI0037984ABF